MIDHPSQDPVVVEVSRIVAYPARPAHFLTGPLDLATAGLAGIAWRFPKKREPGRPALVLGRAAPACVLPDVPDARFRVLERTDFWLECDCLPSVVEVTRVRLSCPAAVLDDPSQLGAWASALESQSFVSAPPAPSNDPHGRKAGGTPGLPRNSDFICVVEAGDSLIESLHRDDWTEIPSRSWRRRLQPPASDLWVVRPSATVAGEAKVDAATVLLLFALVQLRLRVLNDTVRGSIGALAGQAPGSGGSGSAAGPLDRLGDPGNRLEVIRLHQTFLLAKLCFDELRVVKYGDEDGPIYETMLACSGSARLIAERERDFESLTRLVSEAALHREVADGLRSTTVFARAIAALGMLGTIAGVLQAVDRTDSRLPLASQPSWMRVVILVGMLSLLGMLFFGVWFLSSGRLRLSGRMPPARAPRT